MIASAEGGVEIEEVAKKSPEKVLKEPLHPLLGLQAFQARELAYKLGFKDKLAGEAAKLMTEPGEGLPENRCLARGDQSAGGHQGRQAAGDRREDSTSTTTPCSATTTWSAWPMRSQERPLDVRAHKANLNYIALDGTIGCLVNGAGLAMATMDIIKLHGAEPANFLDVGGGVTAEGAIEAFRIILSDPKVKGILVNIFGGIAKCDLIAEALVKAGREVGFKVPVVVRLEGTNVEQGPRDLAGGQEELPTSHPGDGSDGRGEEGGGGGGAKGIMGVPPMFAVPRNFDRFPDRISKSEAAGFFSAEVGAQNSADRWRSALRHPHPENRVGK